MLKHLAFCLALLTGFAVAQVDIPIGAVGPIKEIAKNVLWNGSGLSAINNNYIFSPTATYETACIFITNNDASSHQPIVQLFGTGDQSVTKYQGNSGAWTLLGPGTTFFASVINAGQTTSYGTLIQNAARVAIVITNGSGAGTVSVTMVESPNISGCANRTAINLPVVCTSSVFINALASASTTSIAAPLPGQAVYICNITISAAGALAAGNISLIAGSAATCSSGPFTTWGILTTATTPPIESFSGTPLVPRYPSGTASDNVGLGACLQNNQATTINAFVSYAQF